MDDQRFGSVVRTLRIKRGFRQLDLAKRCGVSRATISRVERGHVDSLSLRTIRSLAAALDVRVDLTPRWRAGDLDRLLNSRHSGLHELVARYLSALPEWVAQPEVSFAVYAERGVIDILAWHPRLRALLVIELKTDITDVNELVGTVHRKGRHAVRVAIEQGWIRAHDPPPTVSIWVIVADGHTNRRRVQAHRAMLRAAFPVDGRAVGGWLRKPQGAIRALSFWPDAHGRNVRAGRTPIRRVSRGSRHAA